MTLTCNAILLRNFFTGRLWNNLWESPGKASLHYQTQPKDIINRFLHLKVKKQPPRPLRTNNFKTLSPYVDLTNPVVRVQLLKTIVNFTLKHPTTLCDFKVPKFTEVDAGMVLPNHHICWRIKKIGFDLIYELTIAKPKLSFFLVNEFTNFCAISKAGVL
jgi:hypothetical protein